MIQVPPLSWTDWTFHAKVGRRKSTELSLLNTKDWNGLESADHMPSFKIPLLSRYVQHILRPDIYELSFFKSWWVSPALIILYLLKGWSVSIVQYETLERCSVLFTTTHAVVILLKPCPTCVVLYVRPVRHVLSFMSVLLDMCCPLC